MEQGDRSAVLAEARKGCSNLERKKIFREDRTLKLLCFMNLKHFNFFFIGSIIYFMNICHLKKHMDIPLYHIYNRDKYENYEKFMKVINKIYFSLFFKSHARGVHLYKIFKTTIIVKLKIINVNII